MSVTAFRAARSSSTISTGRLEGELEAASLGRGRGEADVPADVPGQGAADGEAHTESFATVPLIVVYLVEFVEQVRCVLRRDADARIADAHDQFAVPRPWSR
jgi:hypothetical protein